MSKLNIPFYSTLRQYDRYSERIHQQVEAVFKNGTLINGDFVTQFEHTFKLHSNHSFCVGMSSGTSALFTALKCLDIKEGDEVITSAISAVPTAAAISQTGATPVFVDVDEHNQLDIDQLEKAITKNTKAIVPVHLYGELCDMGRLKKLCDKQALFLVEDCAQAVGATYNDYKAGELSHIAAFSFYPTKNIGAFGDAGAIATSNPDYAKWSKAFSNYGMVDGVATFDGTNNRMDDLQASFLSMKLPELEIDLQTRRDLAELYITELTPLKEVQLPVPNKNSSHSYHLFVIKTNLRNALQAFLNSKGIETKTHYPYTLPELPQYNSKKAFPKASSIKNEALSLPLYPELLPSEVKYICEAIHQFYSNKK